RELGHRGLWGTEGAGSSAAALEQTATAVPHGRLRSGRRGPGAAGRPEPGRGARGSAPPRARLRSVRCARARGSAEMGVSCPVAVELHISNVVDVANYVVSALLPEEMFWG